MGQSPSKDGISADPFFKKANPCRNQVPAGPNLGRGGGYRETRGSGAQMYNKPAARDEAASKVEPTRFFPNSLLIENVARAFVSAEKFRGSEPIAPEEGKDHD